MISLRYLMSSRRPINEHHGRGREGCSPLRLPSVGEQGKIELSSMVGRRYRLRRNSFATKGMRSQPPF